MLYFCSNMNREYRTGQYRVDAILDDAVDSSAIESYVFRTTDGPAEVDPSKLVVFLSSSNVATVGYPDDSDMMDIWKSKAKVELRRQRDHKMEYTGAPTPVLDANGNKIVMDCRYQDKDNIEGLMRIMDAQGITQAEITDYYNKKHVVSREDLNLILIGMLGYVAGLMYEKWQKDVQVDSATNKMDLEAILGGADPVNL